MQEILGRPNRNHQRHAFAFVGLIRCGECGAAVTAENKVQRHGHHYVYYHCTKRKLGPRCSQSSIEVDALEEQIRAFLGRIQIDEELLAWSMNEFRGMETEHRSRVSPIRKSLAAAIQEIRAESAELLTLRCRRLVSDDVFALKSQEITNREISVREKLLHEDTGAKQWFEPSAKTFVFANEAPKLFPMASNANRRQILLSLGSNLELRGKILRMSAQTPFLLVERGRRDSHWGTIVDAYAPTLSTIRTTFHGRVSAN